MTRCIWCLCFLVALALGLGCSSPTPPPSGAVACTFTTGDVPECYGYTNLNSDEVNNAKIQCSAQSGATFVNACPTTGLLGCCHESKAGVTLADCYYDLLDDAGGPPTFQANCMQAGGTWSLTP
jgi:hypothetical protein